MINRRRTHRPRRDPSRYFGVIGIVAVVVLIVAVAISYNASQGVPAQKFYSFWVEVPDAQRLVKANEVRVAGIRVGQVAKVDAVPVSASSRTGAPHARVLLKLSAAQDRVPVDSTTSVRPASILGASYLDIKPGRSGDTVPEGGQLSLDRSRSNVQLTDLLDLFDKPTSKALQGSITSLGDGLAGRGADLGQTVTITARLLPNLAETMQTLSDPRTRLGRFLASYARAIGAFGAESRALADGFANGERTFAALDDRRDDLGRTIDVLPGAARTTTVALRRLRPALDNLADFATDVRPAANVLPSTVGRVNGLFRQVTPTFRTFRTTAPRLRRTAVALRTFSDLPTTTPAIRSVGELAKVAGPVSGDVGEAQINCNSLGMFLENIPSVFIDSGFGNTAGASVRIASLGSNPLEAIQNAKPLPSLHTNYLPHQNAQECESGNEPYSDTEQVLGNPEGNQPKTKLETRVDPKITSQAAAYGLLTSPPPAVKP